MDRHQTEMAQQIELGLDTFGDVTAGPDGSLWFADDVGLTSSIGQFELSGAGPA